MLDGGMEKFQDCPHLTFADDTQALGRCKDLHDFQLFANDVAESGITMYIFWDQGNTLDKVYDH